MDIEKTKKSTDILNDAGVPKRKLSQSFTQEEIDCSDSEEGLQEMTIVIVEQIMEKILKDNIIVPKDFFQECVFTWADKNAGGVLKGMLTPQVAARKK